MKNPTRVEIAHTYRKFVKECLNLEVEQVEAEAQLRKMVNLLQIKHASRNLAPELNLQDENGLLVVSGNHDDFHQVLAINNKAERIFGYHYADVVGQDLVRLQPQVVRANHHQIAMDYMENSLKAKLRTSIWGKHKKGFLIPLFIETVVHVSLEYRLFFAAFVRKNPRLYFEPFKSSIDATEVLTLITDFQGTIYEASRSVFETFSLPMSTFNSGEVQIDELFSISYDEEEQLTTLGKKIDIDIAAISMRLNPGGEGKTNLEEDETIHLFSSMGNRVTMYVFLIRKDSVYHQFKEWRLVMTDENECSQTPEESCMNLHQRDSSYRDKSDSIPAAGSVVNKDEESENEDTWEVCSVISMRSIEKLSDAFGKHDELT